MGKKVLIANRGEIARRIIRTAKELGYSTVAIYSEADRDFPFVHEADEAVCIGPPPVQQSYLQMDKIIAVAKEKKVDFIHPGYGLLSENAAFAEKCTEAGFTFMGPRAQVIALMGDKIKAREAMQAAGVPIVPGFIEPADHIEAALMQAEQLGYPVMLKASAGGGGIGMHICEKADDVQKVYDSAKTRAKAYFGHDAVFVEKYVPNARHIEVQIAADEHGQVVHLYERDCSIQRRHQKVIEEAPSPFISEETRERICAAAVKAAHYVNYSGVGTVEFIMGEDETFYFLEMNTRIQVEHPVTEECVGVDLVALQFSIAEGNRLELTQQEIQQKSVAIEFRVYAEDPQSFLPSPGKVTQYIRWEHDDVRYDDAIEGEITITPFYDPMIAKVIVSGTTREEALTLAEQALQNIKLEGIKHNLPFLLRVVQDPVFKKGKYTTNYVKNMMSS